ncbi:hypothetical protein AVEN_223843-1, partial [Araneus ventricosus]
MCTKCNRTVNGVISVLPRYLETLNDSRSSNVAGVLVALSGHGSTSPVG